MSLLPVLMNELLDDFVYPRPGTLFDQNFGLGLHPAIEAAPRLMQVPLRSGYLRPWRHVPSSDSGISSLQDDKNNFKVSLDVQQFKPEEINVKLQDNYLVIEGKHEERQDKHGYISRQFQRRYKLPENVETDKIKSNLSSDGVLTLVAPKKELTSKGERKIPIQQTNQPALKSTPQQQKGAQLEKMQT